MKKYIGLTEVRGIACVFVLASHLSYITHPYIYLGFLGHWGVMLFFVLSGFLGYSNHYDLDFCIYDYLKKKYSSFGFIYIFSTFIMLLPFLIHRGSTKKAILSALLHIPLLQAWYAPFFPGYDLNQADWFLSAIMFCWLLEKPIILFISKLGKKSLIFFLLGVFLIRITIYYIPFSDQILYSAILYKCPLVRIFDFILGMVGGSLVVKENVPINFGFIDYISIGFFAISLVLYNIVPLKCKEVLLIGISSFLLIIAFANNNSKLTNIFKSKLLDFVAKHSLTIYLIHYVIIFYVMTYLSRFIKLIQVMISIVLVLVCTCFMDYAKPKIFRICHQKTDN